VAAAPLWALAAFLLSAAWSRAQDAPEPPHHMENRFLFVIDTSSAMKSRTNGLEDAVMALLKSGMDGELRKGDTIGVWTYSDRLDTDFPRQVWSEQQKHDIISDVREHLRELHFEKRSHLDKALPEILKVVAHSERVTVILIFDGSDLIKGTPFDKDINELHKKYLHEFKAAHTPFITVLAARNGAVFDYTINYPAKVVIPATADPLPPPETNAPPPVVAIAPPPPVIDTPPAEPKPPPHRIEFTLSGSNFAHNAAAPPPPAPAASNVVAVAAPTPAVVPAVVSNEPPPSMAAPVVIQTPRTNAAPPAPAPRPPASAPAPTPTPTATAPVKPVPVAPAPTPAAAGPVAPAVAAASPVQQAAIAVMAFSLLTIAVVLVMFLVRRSRVGSQPSLISQSIDRTR
jgi:hypothetical protein